MGFSLVVGILPNFFRVIFNIIANIAFKVFEGLSRKKMYLITSFTIFVINIAAVR